MLTLTLDDPDFQSPDSYGDSRPIHQQKIKVKYQSERSVGSKDVVEANGQTDTTDFITFLVNATGNYVRPDVGLFQQSYVWQGDLADNSQMSRLKSSLGDAFVRFFVRMAPAKAMQVFTQLRLMTSSQ